MGVDTYFYVVRGVYFKDEELPKDLDDEVLDNKYVEMADPMSDSSMVVGETLIYTSEHNGVGPTNLAEPSLTEAECISLLPPQLAELYERGIGKFGTWYFVQYS